MQIRPILLNKFFACNNNGLHKQQARYNYCIGQDSVCFTSNSKVDFIDLMYKDWDLRISDGLNTRFHTISGYNEALSNFDVKNFIRLGGESTVFELQDGNILKLATEKYAPFIKKYHAPEVKRGVINLSEMHTAMSSSISECYDTNKIYYVIQKKGMPLTSAQAGDELFEAAKKDGYFGCDFRPEQFAYFKTEKGETLKCVDLGCITDKVYPISRDFEAIERMTVTDICNPYGKTFFTLERYYSDIFKSSDDIHSFIQSITPRIKSGENIFKVMNEFLKEHGKPPIHHIKFP